MASLLATRRTAARPRRLRGGCFIAVICVLALLGIGLWRVSTPSAAGPQGVIIAVGGGPNALAITRDGEIWIADADAGQIEEQAEPMVGTQGGGLRTAGRPGALVASTRQAIFYADTGGQIASIASYGLNTRWTLPALGGPSALAISPDGHALYVASEYRDRVVAVNTATGRAGAPIRTGLEPVAMTVSPDGRRLYVANELAGDITVINTATWRRAAVIAVARFPGLTPVALAVSPDGAWLYVADLVRNAVMVVNTATGRVRSVIPVGRRPVALALTKDGRTLYVANNADNSVTPINTATRSAGAPIPVGREPDALAITPDGHYLYVANFGDNTLSQLPIKRMSARRAA